MGRLKKVLLVHLIFLFILHIFLILFILFILFIPFLYLLDSRLDLKGVLDIVEVLDEEVDDILLGSLDDRSRLLLLDNLEEVRLLLLLL